MAPAYGAAQGVKCRLRSADVRGMHGPRRPSLGPRVGTTMILTVTVNAAIDKTLTVPSLQLGHRHRAQQGLTMPGGKGINVARVLKRLGDPVIATGLVGGRTGVQIVDGLSHEGILNDFVRIAGESRTSTAVVDPTNGVQTEINEYGPEVTADELATLLEKLHYLSGRSRWPCSPAACRARSTSTSTPTWCAT